MSTRSRLMAAALTAASLLGAACGASDEVREAVAERNRAAAFGVPATSFDSNGAAHEDTSVAPAAGTLDDSDPVTPDQQQERAASAAAPRRSRSSSAPSAATARSTARAGRSPSSGGGAQSNEAAPAPRGGSARPGATAPVPAPGVPAPGRKGNGGATDVGVTAESIKIGGLFFNGSWLDKYSQVAEQAAAAYFRYVNDQGGIHGRKITFVGCDTAATVNGTQGCIRKLAEQDKVFSLGPTLDFNLDTTLPYLAEKKLPWIGTPGLYDAEFQSPYIFATQYPGKEMGAIAATFMLDQLGARTIGMSWNTQPPGPECFDGVRRVAEALGAEIVVDASNGPTESDLSPQVIRIRSANPDTIIFCNDPVNAVKFVQAAGRQNYKPPTGWIGAFCLADDVPQAMGPAGVGFYCISSYDPYFSDTPGIVEMNQITSYYFPSHFHHQYTMPVFAGAKVLVEAVRRIGPDLTREKLLATMRSMESFDTRMGIAFNFASREKERASGMVMQADENLRWKRVTNRFPVAG